VCVKFSAAAKVHHFTMASEDEGIWSGTCIYAAEKSDFVSWVGLNSRWC